MRETVAPKISYDPMRDEALLQIRDKLGKPLSFGNFVIYKDNNNLCAVKILNFSEEIEKAKKERNIKPYPNPLLKIAGIAEIGPMTSKEIDKKVYNF
ncbi:hypothetical protein KAW96_09070 [candidate division WOR-3 bacterium]|nr:hypothetical protein [candidate division WOR-3 bacterium]